MTLKDKKCVPCEGGVESLKLTEVTEYMKELHRNWELIDNKLVRRWNFRDFNTALEFVNKIGEIAEEERHHPEIAFGWGKVKAELWTHAINGLSENDFILAAKIDEIRL